MDHNQMESATKAMIAWLADEHELGKAPSMIDCAGEFDLHEYHYYIFKYKKGFLGKWLLGVCGGYEPGDTEHCGHVFSEMEPYDSKTAVEKSIQMVEKIRAYWMQQAQEQMEKQSQQEPPAYDTGAATPEQLERKARSIAILKEKGVPYIEHLPVIEIDVTPRTPEEIAKRAIACLLSVQVACDFAHDGDVEESRKFFLSMLETFGVTEELTPAEKKIFFGEPTKQDAINIGWKYEAYWPLIWALGLVDELKYPDQICDCEHAIEVVSSCGSFAEFMQSTSPRTIEEILDEADLIFRYDWACVEARIHGKEAPAGLNSSVVVERHWGLNWLIGKNSDNEDWDTVSTNT